MKSVNAAQRLNDAREFFRAIVEGDAYKRKFRLRAEAGELAPAVELRMLEYVFGKIPDKIEVVDDTDLSEFTNEELRAMLAELDKVLAGRDDGDGDEERKNVDVQAPSIH